MFGTTHLQVSLAARASSGAGQFLEHKSGCGIHGQGEARTALDSLDQGVVREGEQRRVGNLVQAQRQVERRETQLIVVDEVHHLGRGRGAAADTLKHFSNLMPSATFVYVGIDLPGSGLLGHGPGQQISSRFTLMETDRKYEPVSTDWGRVVATFAENLRLSRTSRNDVVKLSPLLHELTGGRIGHLAILLADANLLAMQRRDPGTMDEIISADLLRSVRLPYSAPVPRTTKRRGKQERGAA